MIRLCGTSADCNSFYLPAAASTKKLAKDMVERWSRPIFADAEADAAKRERKRQQHEQRMALEKDIRAAKLEKEAEEAKARLEAKNKGDKNYR
jgi:hypothetical protein